jgi:hypothetical protein
MKVPPAPLRTARGAATTKETPLAATQSDYLALADRWDRWLVDTNTLLSDSSMLGVPPPNLVDYAYAALQHYPDQVRREGARRAGMWTDPPLERYDTDPKDGDNGP